jgi:hypothetical protein
MENVKGYILSPDNMNYISYITGISQYQLESMLLEANIRGENVIVEVEIRWTFTPINEKPSRNSRTGRFFGAG